jgi:hypothetical protein
MGANFVTMKDNLKRYVCRWGEAYLSNAPSHPAGNTSFIHSFMQLRH